MPWEKEHYINFGGVQLYYIWLTMQRLENYKKQNKLYQLIPSPHIKYNIDEVESFMKKMESEWEKERYTRTTKEMYPIAFPFTKLPLNTKLWAYGVIKQYRKIMKDEDKVRREAIAEIENIYGVELSAQPIPP